MFHLDARLRVAEDVGLVAPGGQADHRAHRDEDRRRLRRVRDGRQVGARHGRERLDQRVDPPDDDHRQRHVLGEAHEALEAEVVVDDHHEREDRGEDAQRRDLAEQRGPEAHDEDHREQVEGHAVDDEQQRDEPAAGPAEDAARRARVGLPDDGADVGRPDAVDGHRRRRDRHRPRELAERQALEAGVVAHEHGAEDELHRPELQEHPEVRLARVLRDDRLGVVGDELLNGGRRWFGRGGDGRGRRPRLLGRN